MSENLSAGGWELNMGIQAGGHLEDMHETMKIQAVWGTFYVGH